MYKMTFKLEKAAKFYFSKAEKHQKSKNKPKTNENDYEWKGLKTYFENFENHVCIPRERQTPYRLYFPCEREKYQIC